MASSSSTTDLHLAAKPARRVRNRTRRNRRGYTLIEGMLASLLLAASALGIGGAMQASYEHDRYCQQRRDALESGRRLMDEVTALPLDPQQAGQPSISGLSPYSDNGVTSTGGMSTTTTTTTTSGGGTGGSSGGLLSGTVNAVTSLVGGLLGGGGGGGSSSGSGSTTTTTTTAGGSNSTASAAAAPITGASRKLKIKRRAGLTGGTVSNGDFATITVEVTMPDQRTYELKRLLTSVEGSSNTGD